MTDLAMTDIAVLELPFGRVATIREVEFESGLKMLRLILKEGHRITQVDLDGPTAAQMGAILSDNAPVTEPN